MAYQNSYSRSEQAKYDAVGLVSQAAWNCLKRKCRSHNVGYIAPQELIATLPSSLKIDRKKDIKTIHGGQWEIKNKYIHCYVGFQMQSDDVRTKLLLKDLVRKNSEQYRNNYVSNAYNDNSIPDTYNFDGTACSVCGMVHKDPFCRVSGYFKCYNSYCNGNSFKVGICLLDPFTETPPTRYRCANCGNHARFIRYDLKKITNNNLYYKTKPHRSDLCEACFVWGDCQKMCIQPQVIWKALYEHHGVDSIWTINEIDCSINCSFLFPERSKHIHYSFDIKPYIHISYINPNRFYANYGKRNYPYYFNKQKSTKNKRNGNKNKKRNNRINKPWETTVWKNHYLWGFTSNTM